MARRADSRLVAGPPRKLGTADVHLLHRTLDHPRTLDAVEEPASRRLSLLASPAPREEWLELLAADPEALPFQHPRWTDAITTVSGGRDASRLYRMPSGTRAVLPAVARPAWTAGGAALLVDSHPYPWGTGGLVVPGRDLAEEDVRALFAALAREAALRVTLRPAPRRSAAYEGVAPRTAVRASRTGYVLDLDGGFDRVWKERFTSSARQAVRKAEHAPLSIRQEVGGRLTPEFQSLYRLSVRRWAEQQHEPLWLARLRARRQEPGRKVAAVAAAFPATCRMWLASISEQPAAAIITLQWGEHVVYWRGAMDKALAGPSRANNLLHRLAIEQAIADGARFYHFGDSPRDSGVSRFKASFGAAPVDRQVFTVERVPLTAAHREARRMVKRVVRRRFRS